MQFHLNGFHTGDPAVAAPALDVAGIGDANALPATVDVLIVGCGPAGLTLATQLAAFPAIRTRIVEQKSGPLQLGQADGVACRSMEMFEAFGFAEQVLKESYWVNETTFWKADPADPGRLVRANRIQDVEDGLSEMPHTILNQARIHDFYLQAMRQAPWRLVPDYNRRLLALAVEADDTTGYPVRVTLERTDAGAAGIGECPQPWLRQPPQGGAGKPGDGPALSCESLCARYVVGCDGARSAVRQSLGHALRGDSANQIWGVMDVLAVTDFPDVRLKCAIQSGQAGSMLIIPREGGYLVRMYIEMDALAPSERVADRHLTVEQLIAAAQRILLPYVLEVKEVVWWSAYEIGQRVSDSFDDVPDDARQYRTPHVFIAGDACHTHSPKAGQGMNVSMADAFNLGWKIAAVLHGQADAQLLHTYALERRAKAVELIAFDRDMARLFSARPTAGGAGADATRFQQYFAQHGRYTAGVETCYDASLITGVATHQQLASGLVIGKRLHSAPVIRLADARPMQLGHTVKADGRWRLLVFAGRDDRGGAPSGVAALCDQLAHASDSPVLRYTPVGADIDSVIDVRAVFQHHHRDLDLRTMPAALKPRKGRYGLIDYEKIFCADQRPGQDIFDLRAIDRAQGCLVVVRPDQFVAHVLPLDGVAQLCGFFERFMRPRAD